MVKLFLFFLKDLNVLDWSKKNVVAVALKEKVYLWYGETQEVEELQGIGYEGVMITALSWAEKGRFLAIGLDNGRIQVRWQEIIIIILLLLFIVVIIIAL